MIVLDTNVISELMQDKTNTLVVKWLDAQPIESIWTTSVCVYEILYGIHLLKKGKRRRYLEKAFEKILDQNMEGRVLDFDSTAAWKAAPMSAKLRAAGRPVEIRDVQIAGIVASRRGTLATGNTKHFFDTGISLINPWEDDPV